MAPVATWPGWPPLCGPSRATRHGQELPLVAGEIGGDRVRCQSCGEEAPEWAIQCPSCGGPAGPQRGPGFYQGSDATAGPGSYPPPGPWAASAPYPPPGPEAYPPPYGGPSPSQWGAWASPGQGPWAGNSYPPTGRHGRLAGWWYRVGATLIDNLIVSVVGAVIGGAAHSIGVVYAVDLLASLTYTALLLGSPRAQTVGMMAVGTRCLDVRTGVPIGVPRSAARWLIQELLVLTIVGGLLDIFWPIPDRRNQTLHDKAVGSVIVHSR